MDAKKTEQIINALSHSQIFHDITPGDLAALIGVSTLIEAKPGQVILDENEKVPGLHVLLEGSIQVVKAGVPLSTMGRGSFFGEISVFGVSLSATARVQSKDQTLCLMIKKADLDGWGRRFPAAERIFLYRMCTELCRRLYSTTDRIA